MPDWQPLVRAKTWYLAAAIWILLDQLTKYLAESSLTYARPVEVLPVLDFTLLYNPGAAFSFLSDAGGWQRWFFIALSSVVSVMLLWMLPRQTSQLGKVSFCMILAGAIGNLIDRVRFGHVVDFIHFHWQGNYFPAFNLADSAISVGVCLLLIQWFILEKNESNNT